MPIATLDPTPSASPEAAPEPAQPGIVLPRRMLSTGDLSEYFGVKQFTIRDWAKRGLLPPGRRIGKFLRWHPDEIAPYLTAGSI
jgi:hypothetical protein